MAIDRHKVAFQYVPSFKGDATLLLTGDHSGLEALAELLQTLASSANGMTMLVDRSAVFAGNPEVKLVVTVAGSRLGMHRVASESGQRKFDWRLSPPLAAYFAELIRAVADAQQPSHQYLDGEADDIAVVVSKDEYGES
jgi:NADPH-dependent ferric siderophore reductase